MAIGKVAGRIFPFKCFVLHFKRKDMGERVAHRLRLKRKTILDIEFINGCNGTSTLHCKKLGCILAPVYEV